MKSAWEIIVKGVVCIFALPLMAIIFFLGAWVNRKKRK
jgi:hypothetical protein